MPNIQVSYDQRREIYDAHHDWLTALPRVPGQLGVSGMLVEGPPVKIENEVTTFFGSQPIAFYKVNPDFVAFLRKRNIAFREV